VHYEIRSKGLRLEMRDRGAPGQPILRLSEKLWTRFELLPIGIGLDDGQVDVRVVSDPPMTAPAVVAPPAPIVEIRRYRKGRRG